MLNVGIISVWHVHADDYANAMQKSGKVDIKAVWDCDGARGRAWADKHGIEFIADYDEFLARKDITAVVCTSPTTMHPELLGKAARAGKDIFTEKLLAATVADCEKLCKQIDDSGVVFTVSLPLRARPQMLYAKELVASGKLGRVSAARMRRSHSGVSDRWLPEYWFDTAMSGGGAMMDLGAHAAYTLPFLFGEPLRISGMTSNLFGTSSDENAIALVEFAGGVLGTCETAFVTFGVPDILEIYGTEGSLFIRGERTELAARGADGKCVVESIAPQALPKEKPAPILQFIDACIDRTGTPDGLGTKDALTMTRIIEAMYLSDKQSKCK